MLNQVCKASKPVRYLTHEQVFYFLDGSGRNSSCGSQPKVTAPSQRHCGAGGTLTRSHRLWCRRVSFSRPGTHGLSNARSLPAPRLQSCRTLQPKKKERERERAGSSRASWEKTPGKSMKTLFWEGGYICKILLVWHRDIKLVEALQSKQLWQRKSDGLWWIDH